MALGWRNQGNALVELKRFSEAVACYDHALRLSPNDEIAAQARYQAQSELGLATQPPTTQPASIQTDICSIPTDLEVAEFSALPSPIRRTCASLVIDDESGCHLIELSDRVQTLGRDPQNDITLRSQFVSRYHAVIELVTHPDGYPVFQIRDGSLEGKRSTNGIVINGQPVREAFLRHQDLVVFGPKAKAIFRQG